ncbi:hypothetical protein GOODEAATRI_009385 [Goodea atripinnis]|uniref:Uncharacterized protein n=1 Tax=Goodea atripinnis TaxID=208336 RepID=A0ABV0N9B3_9TELE
MKDRTAELRSVSSFSSFHHPCWPPSSSPPLLSSPSSRGRRSITASAQRLQSEERRDGGDEKLLGPPMLRVFSGSAEVWMRVALRPGAFHAVNTECAAEL